MKCPNCGIELSEDSKFCNECGTRIITKKSERKTNRKQPIIIMSIIVFFFLIVIAGNYYSKWCHEKTLDDIENVSVEIKDMERMLHRFDELHRKNNLSLAEIEEKNKIRKMIKKEYYKMGKQGKELWKKFNEMYPY